MGNASKGVRQAGDHATASLAERQKHSALGSVEGGKSENTWVLASALSRHTVRPRPSPFSEVQSPCWHKEDG